MAELPTFTIKQLIDSGVHYGHKTMRWNPKMAPFLFGSRDNIHIIDLQQTVPLLHRALTTVKEVVKNNGRVLFVGTKRQASDIVAESAKRCGQYYVNHRWLAGMLTNWKTNSLQIQTLNNKNKLLEEAEANPGKMTKKEKLQLIRHRDKLNRSLGGIVEMGGKPDLLFIIDTNKEDLALKEAIKLNIPIIAILDSNSNPDGINFPVPGNDDATRAIKLYCKLISDAALSGIQEAMSETGVDIGESESSNLEEIIEKNSDSKSKKNNLAKTPIRAKNIRKTSKQESQN